MEKHRKTLVYAAVGACGGAVTLASAAGPCVAGDCSACFRCVGTGVVLVALALFNRIKRNETNGLLQNGKKSVYGGTLLDTRTDEKSD